MLNNFEIVNNFQNAMYSRESPLQVCMIKKRYGYTLMRQQSKYMIQKATENTRRSQLTDFNNRKCSYRKEVVPPCPLKLTLKKIPFEGLFVS